MMDGQIVLLVARLHGLRKGAIMLGLFEEESGLFFAEHLPLPGAPAWFSYQLCNIIALELHYFRQTSDTVGC